jgi:hypothetical protein
MSEHATPADLLLFLDSELPEGRALAMEAHLDECPSCMRQYWALREASNHVVDAYRGAIASVPAAAPNGRLRLSERMREDVERRWSLRATLVCTVTAALLFLMLRFEASLLEGSLFLERGALPASALTPGAAVADVSLNDVCSGARRSAPVTPSMRLQVLRNYGMEHVPPDQYELDYLITPELGGLTDPRNLWPEPYGLRAWNAHAKDSLEHALPRLVCSGRIDLATAQREIAGNWIDAYKKYLASDRPIQIHARLLLSNGPARDW